MSAIAIKLSPLIQEVVDERIADARQEERERIVAELRKLRDDLCKGAWTPKYATLTLCILAAEGFFDKKRRRDSASSKDQLPAGN